MDGAERALVTSRIAWLRLAAEQARKRAREPNLLSVEIQRALTRAQGSDVYADELQAELDAQP